MAILAGFDVHRAQITFDALDTDTGEVLRGRMRGDRDAVSEWMRQFAGEHVEVAVEACTGWLFVYEQLTAAGAVVHLAEPAETSALRGKKRHAKTDRADARWLRTLLAEGRLPEAWIPPAHVREWRTQTRLRKTLIDERTSWLQRIQATLFHHGIVNVPDQLLRANGRAFLHTLALPPASMQRIEIALAIIDELERQLIPLEREITRLARHQAGCQALMRQYGVGPITATTILVRARRRHPPLSLAQSRPLQRPGRRRLPLRPSLPDRTDHPPRRARPALGALRSRPMRLQGRQPRPRRLPRAQSPRTLTHPRLADHRPQTGPPQLPHPARTRPRRARPDLLTTPPSPIAPAAPSSLR